jgi:hypothetical protein
MYSMYKNDAAEVGRSAVAVASGYAEKVAASGILSEKRIAPRRTGLAAEVHAALGGMYRLALGDDCAVVRYQP